MAELVSQKAKVAYNLGPNRPNKPDQRVIDAIQGAVTQSLGPDYTVNVISGKEHKGHQHGSNRHKTGLAADVQIIGPDGKTLTAKANKQALVDVAKAFRSLGGLGIGLGTNYMGARGMHLDMFTPGPGQSYGWGNIGNAYAAAPKPGKGFAALVDRPSLPQSAPIPPSRPSAPLSPFTPAPVGKVERMALPSIARPTPQPTVSPAKQIAAYQQYGGSRAAAPAVPTTPVDPKILNAYQQYAQTRMAAPTTPVPALTQLQMPPAPILPTPPQVRLQPVPAPVLAPVQESYPAAPQRPSLTATDVWNGSPGTAMSTGGNKVSGDEFGNVAVTNQFGATTINNARGNQAAGSLIDGPLGGPKSPFGGISLPSVPGNVGQFAKTGLGTVAGSAIGSFGGPIGSVLGALIGRELAKPNGGAIGGFLNGTKNVNTSQIPGFAPVTAFAKPQGGLAFPDRPGGGISDPRFSNNSYEGMRDISPKAAKDISNGKAGLF